ncbi:hypothetical protein VSDG_06276 [Cytospora chrysosperma]|uniref:Uncharacterized protein n=1 Tax=Cytospora chrysosperma TaxID=252740 RepID=A0A423VSC3_CYTCH|nr:hypothetical protein VSDG_06276 [Valsa sordida]
MSGPFNPNLEQPGTEDAGQVSAPKETEIVVQEVQVAEQPDYCLDWAIADEGQLDEELECLEQPQTPPYNHEMAEVITMEDLNFFTALLKGQDPPSAEGRAKDFLDEQQRAERRNHGDQVYEVHVKRKEELELMQADMDFYLTLMQEG